MNNNNHQKNSANKKNKAVLDASALRALFFEEEGSRVVYTLLGDACLSAVTLTELMNILAKEGVSTPLFLEQFKQLELPILEFSEAQSLIAGKLLEEQGALLSLTDAAALSLAIQLELPIYTARKPWATLNLPIAVHVIA